MLQGRQYSNYVHSVHRVYERYGVDLLYTDYKNIIQKIQDGEGTFIERMTRSRSIFNVDYNGKSFTVVYDKNNHNIVTFLPYTPISEEEKKIRKCPACGLEMKFIGTRFKCVSNDCLK